MEPDERAAAGVFLAFQAPVELPGVNNANFLRTAVNAVRRARGEAELDAMQFLKAARAQAKALSMPEDLLKRNVNVGFSGGEKKRNEVLQMAMLAPSFAILDETDSGLDIDALRIVAEGVQGAALALVLGAGHHPSPAVAGLPGAGPGARDGARAHPAQRRAGAGAPAGSPGLCRLPGGGGVNVIVARRRGVPSATPRPDRAVSGDAPGAARGADRARPGGGLA